MRGAGPMMEIFDAKVEASNPGCLLVDVNRIIDTAPHSRNETMASFLRMIHICEERGSGFDRMEEGMSAIRFRLLRLKREMILPGLNYIGMRI